LAVARDRGVAGFAPSAGASLQSLHAEIAGAQNEEQEMLATQERRANLQQLLHNPVAKITEAKVFSVT
jgi:hypothetical protein